MSAQAPPAPGFSSLAAAPPSLRQLSGVALKIGCLGFGGPAGQIALMHRIFVDQRKWVDEERFLHALSFCMLLPGPEAQQLATYIGWRLHGVGGGLIAGVLFVAPGAAVMLALSWIYAAAGDLDFVAAAFFGVRAAVLALVAEALVRVGRRALKTAALWLIAALGFLALWFAQAPFPLVIAGAALLGFALPVEHSATPAHHDAPPASARAALVSAGVWGALWLAPPAAAVITLGPHAALSEIGALFSMLSVVTFGGAYASLAFLAQQAVEARHWLDAAQMIDGLGLAETTPGPLVLVNQFVGFMAGWREGGAGLALAGAAMATWCTFAPSLVWIFVGAPYAERLRNNPRAGAVLQSISAATFGVIANMAAWFAIHVLFTRVERTDLSVGVSTLAPHWQSLDLTAAALCAISLLLAFWLRLGPLWLVLSAIGLGVFARFLF